MKLCFRRSTEAMPALDLILTRAREALLRFVFGADGSTRNDSMGTALRAAMGLAAFGIAFAVDALAPNPASGFSLLLYLPAIFIVAFVAGWAWGLLALVASVGSAWWFASDPLYDVASPNGAPGLTLFIVSGTLLYGAAVFARAAIRANLRDHHDRMLANEKRDLVIGEMRHRMKNLITVIEALAKNSRRQADDGAAIDAFLKRFFGRLEALGAAADLVLAGNRVAIDVNAVVRATLVPFEGEKSNRIRIDGPDLQLSEELGGGLALAVHELATNALKYGALSVPGGTIAFTWTVAPMAGGEEVAFEWTERGGPAPEPPTREGFGHRVIKAVTTREKDGRVTIEYPPEGLICRMSYVRPRAAAN
ncbi:MAG: HWE histidine kinase domain-containing protein [Rhizomicrobium sp.]